MEEKNENKEKAADLAFGNLFRKIPVNKEAPEDLKETVFDTLDTLALLGDIFDLFTLKFGQSGLDFLESPEEENTDS